MECFFQAWVVFLSDCPGSHCEAARLNARLDAEGSTRKGEAGTGFARVYRLDLPSLPIIAVAACVASPPTHLRLCQLPARNPCTGPMPEVDSEVWIVTRRS